MRGVSSSPKRSESSTATGRAPSAKTSRRMPPTPVAAPWNGSTAEGWLWLSTLNDDREPVAGVDRAGVLARAHQHALALGRERAQQLLRVLVGAVLGPQQREDRQLERVRLAARAARRCARTPESRQPERRRAWASRRGTVTPAPPRGTARRASGRASRRRSSRSARRRRARGGASGRRRSRCSFATPAMSRSEPFGFVAGRVAQHDLAVRLELLEQLRRARSSARSCA